MATSKAQIKAVRKYEQKAYMKVNVRIPKEIEEEFRKKANGSMNGYVISLIKKDLGIKED